jgi:membrane associated rhomboid family serine protease
VILLVPLGPDAERARVPYVTTALVALNVLVFLASGATDAARVAREEESLERVAAWTLDNAGRQHPGLAARRGAYPSALAFVLGDTAWPDEISAPEDRERLLNVREDGRRLHETHAFYEFGFVPADPWSVGLVTHLFLHADLLHLGFNMLFLWAVGGLLEQVWGEALFAAFYLASGIVAALVHAAVHANSVEPAIGASGAVAGLMGAFAAGHARQPMRLAVVAVASLSPRLHFVTWPAWVFLGLWLLEQVFYALLTANMKVGIAFGAHLGGFAFGLAAGAAIARVRPAAA